MSEMRKRRKIKPKPYACVNHPSRTDTKECDRCHKLFCEDCRVEKWQQNFLSEFAAQKRNFASFTYCLSCEKSVKRRRLITHFSILIMIVLPFFIVLFLLPK